MKSAFLFFVLTSGRPLLVTTFFVFSKQLCSHFAAQIKIREFSALLQQRCLSLSKGFPLQRETAKICYCCSQPFYSSFVALLEVILQRCSNAARFVREAALKFLGMRWRGKQTLHIMFFILQLCLMSWNSNNFFVHNASIKNPNNFTDLILAGLIYSITYLYILQGTFPRATIVAFQSAADFKTENIPPRKYVWIYL